MDAVREHGIEVTDYLVERLREHDGVTVYGPEGERGALATFTLDGIHPHDVAEILGRDGVCVRAGHHCAQPLMRRLGISASTRASVAIHNTHADVDRLIDGLGTVQEIFA
jgi:cysteine desulfurase/selenocysteine lyase